VTNNPQFEHDIRQRLKAVRLPSMSQILLKLMDICQSEDTGISELARLVAQDPAMTAKMMFVANSSVYHRNESSYSLEQALSIIGTDMIKTIVINESVFQVFDKFARINGLDLNCFWKHSLFAAVKARMLAVKMQYSNPEEAYLSGLLHDVGRLAMLGIAPKEYFQHFLAEDSDSLCLVEVRTFQASHAEVGALLIQQWKLDSFIADSVLYHHEPASRVEHAHPLIRLTHIAHLLAGENVDRSKIEMAVLLSGLSELDIHEINESATEQVKNSAKYFGIHFEPDPEVQAGKKPMPAMQREPKEKLSTEVKNMVLAGQIDKTFSNQSSEIGLIETITQSASILFNLEHAIILQFNRQKNELRGTRAGKHRNRLADFILPIGENNGQIADSILRSKLVLIGDDKKELGVPEEQLLRLFETERLTCMPLVVDGQCLGVLVGGIAAWQGADFVKNEKFLNVFSLLAANALRKILSRHDEIEVAEVRMAQEYREASRKVAHEVNNPLSIIKNYLGILDRKLLNKDLISGELSILNEEIDRVGKIVDDFSELDLLQKKSSSEIGRVVQDVLKLFQQTEFFVESVKIEFRMLDGKVEVNVSADALKQILINLIKNAVEAMPSGGMIEIISQGLVNRDGVLYSELSVKDTGPGIAHEVMANLFKPVQSTKGLTHSGLGLSIVHDLVKKMNGLISCRSSRQGTIFDMLLPVTSDAEATSAMYS
jgi:HD-like signal output (HDOD) protein/signal transduction histidine kinase